MAAKGPQPSEEEHQPTPPLPSSTMKTYNMYYTTSRLNVRLHLGSPDTPCLYYGLTTILTTHPQLQLLRGVSKTAPAVAFAKWHLSSRHMEIGHSSTSTSEIVWESLRREKFRLQRSDYEFETGIGSKGGERRTYEWRVDKHLTKTVYRCFDEGGVNVANMFSGGVANWKKGGEIEVVEGCEGALEELLIVSALAIWAAEAGWSVFRGYGKGHGGAGKDSGVVS